MHGKIDNREFLNIVNEYINNELLTFDAVEVNKLLDLYKFIDNFKYKQTKVDLEQRLKELTSIEATSPKRQRAHKTIAK